MLRRRFTAAPQMEQNVKYKRFFSVNYEHGLFKTCSNVYSIHVHGIIFFHTLDEHWKFKNKNNKI